MVDIFISLGSNLNPERHVNLGLSALRARFGPLRQSPIYECPAVGFVGPNFHNLVVTWPSEEDPRQIQKELHKIEETYGRSRDKTREGAKFSSRTLDLDLILYGDRVMAEPGLILPRPDIIRYAFVLRPLADLAPLHRHPAIGRTFADLWQEFDVAKQPLWPLA